MWFYHWDALTLTDGGLFYRTKMKISTLSLLNNFESGFGEKFGLPSSSVSSKLM